MNDQTDETRETETDVELELYLGTVDMSGSQREVRINLLSHIICYPIYVSALWFHRSAPVWVGFIVERI